MAESFEYQSLICKMILRFAFFNISHVLHIAILRRYLMSSNVTSAPTNSGTHGTVETHAERSVKVLRFANVRKKAGSYVPRTSAELRAHRIKCRVRKLGAYNVEFGSLMARAKRSTGRGLARERSKRSIPYAPSHIRIKCSRSPGST